MKEGKFSSKESGRRIFFIVCVFFFSSQLFFVNIFILQNESLNNSEVHENNYKEPFIVRKIYSCGFIFNKIIHSSFFPEHHDKLEKSVELRHVENVLDTLRNSSTMDLLISGGVDGCLNQIFKKEQRRHFSEFRWNKWLGDNFDGTYIVCKYLLLILINLLVNFLFESSIDNGEANGGEQWLSEENFPNKRHFHVGYGRETCKSTVMTYLAMHNAWTNETVLLRNRKRTKLSSKENFLIYINSKCIPFRENAFANLALSFHNKTLHYSGKCRGIKGSDKTLMKKFRESNNTKLFKGTKRTEYLLNRKINNAFRFCLVFENKNIDGYVTEKILNAFAGGCIPIYYGTKEIFDIFNPFSLIYYDIENPQSALEKITYLETNEKAFQMVLKEPVLKNSTSYHDFISLNGSLKKRVRDMVLNDNGSMCKT